MSKSFSVDLQRSLCDGFGRKSAKKHLSPLDHLRSAVAIMKCAGDDASEIQRISPVEPISTCPFLDQFSTAAIIRDNRHDTREEPLKRHQPKDLVFTGVYKELGPGQGLAPVPAD